MADRQIPVILIVDDQEEIRSFARLLVDKGLAKSKVLRPEDVTQKDLDDADLVLVDYQIEDWPECADGPIGRRPPDGLALASVLRRHIKGKTGESPTAFAILTGQIEALASPLAPEYKHHVLARYNNLEWVFEKVPNKKVISLDLQVAELANAVMQLPLEWLPDKDRHSINQLIKLLGEDPTHVNVDTLIDDISKCLPPLHELSEWTHGLTLLRWFLHRILPYPCFLLDIHYLAARLRIDYTSLQEALKPGTKIHNALNSCKYTGMLAGFLGERWWRSKIELFLWEQTHGRSFDVAAVHKLINELAGYALPLSVPASRPVVCLNKNFQPVDTFVAIEAAVRIRPDDWPAFADQAWTSIELINETPELRSLVVEEDKEKLL